MRASHLSISKIVVPCQCAGQRPVFWRKPSKKKAPPLWLGKALDLLQFRIIRHLLRSLQQSLLREPQLQELLLPSCQSDVCA